MAKFICSVCGYIHEDLTAPENCPVCMAPASEFSEVKEVPPTENGPIENIVNDEVEETIETKGEITDQSEKTDESHPENSANNIVESNETTNPINNNGIQGINNENAVNTNGKLDADEEAILEKYQENPAAVLQLVKWYIDTYHVGLKEAKDRVDFVLDKHGLRKAKSGSGCMVTILIAITSALSSSFLM